MTKKRISRVAIYARQSSGDDDKSPSVEDQIAQLTKYANDNSYTIKTIESDCNISGRTYPALPESIEMANKDRRYLKEIKKKKEKKKFRTGLANIIKALPDIDAVLVYDHTRLMRPATRSHLENHIAQHFIYSGTVLLLLNGTEIDFSDTKDTLYNAIDNIVQDDALQTLKQKTYDGIRFRRDTGMLWNSSIVNAYGYKQSGKQNVTVIPEEAAIVKEIFDMFVIKNMSLIKIAKVLNERKVPTKTRNSIRKDKRHITSIWRQDSIKYILRRHHYVGYDYDSNGNRITIKPLIGKELVGEELFLKAQKLLETNKKYKTYLTNTIHPLSGLLFCGYCGGRMHRASRNEYICHDNTVTKFKTLANEGCRATRIKETNRSKWKQYHLWGLLESIQGLLAIALINKINKMKSVNNYDTQIYQIETELKNIERLEQTYTDMFEKKSISAEQLERNMKSYRDKYEVLKKDLQKINEKMILSREDLSEEQMFVILATLGAGDIKREAFRDIVRDNITKIKVFAYFIDVIFNDGTTIRIERCNIGVARCLPPCKVFFEEDTRSAYVFYFAKNYQSKNEYGLFSIDETKFNQYKKLYDTEKLKVFQVGNNDNIRKAQPIYSDYVVHPDRYDLPNYLNTL